MPYHCTLTLTERVALFSKIWLAGLYCSCMVEQLLPAGLCLLPIKHEWILNGYRLKVAYLLYIVSPALLCARSCKSGDSPFVSRLLLQLHLITSLSQVQLF